MRNVVTNLRLYLLSGLTFCLPAFVQAQTDLMQQCQAYGGPAYCARADVWFFPTVGDHAGQTYSSGDAACAVAPANDYQRTVYRNAAFAVDAKYATGCWYDYYESGTKFVSRVFVQGWVGINQICPSVGFETFGWDDSAGLPLIGKSFHWCGFGGRAQEEQSCPINNPVLAGTGRKIHQELDWAASDGAP